ASIPEPHNRFTVTAGVSTVNPAFKPTCRAPYSASALVCITFPKIAWSKSLASTPDRLIASLEACAARSIADTSENAPVYRALGAPAPRHDHHVGRKHIGSPRTACGTTAVNSLPLSLLRYPKLERRWEPRKESDIAGLPR